MTCDAIRQLLLGLDLDEKSRPRVAEALAHLESCEPCRQALQDFDKLAALLRPGEPVDEPLWLPGESEDGGEPSAAGIPSQLADQSDVSPTGGWEAFERGLLAAARGDRHQPLSMRHHRWLPALASLAAMVLIGWGAFHLGKRWSNAGEAPVVDRPVVDPSRSVLVADHLSPDDMVAQLRTFDAVDQFFGGRTRWLMLSGSNTTDVGLINQCPDSPATRGAGDKILLVRLNLVRGGNVVSQADVLIVAGTTANVVVPTNLGPLRYHIVTSALDPMRLRVQVQVARPGVAQMVASSQQGASGPAVAILGTSLDLEPYLDASAGQLMLDRQAFDLQVAAAASNLPG